MDRLIDYILWMGDFPISATGFREADALVLCMLSYFDLSALFEGGVKAARVSECLRMVEGDSVHVEIVGRDLGYRDILRQAANSRRYGSLIMTDYVDRRYEDPPLQFAAVTFHDESNLSFVAFRGTDSSLVGWREDFMISFTHTKAQEMARAYAQEVITPAGRRWLMGGHSKGGNLALYAACNVKDVSIDQVYMLDSPGLCPDIMDLGGLYRIEERITHIIPVFSIVGRLFPLPLPNIHIVKSTVRGFLQHSLATWGIDHGRLARAEENDSQSRFISEVLNQWIGKITREERLIFINDIFDALSASGAKTLDDFSSLTLKDYDLIWERLSNLRDITRRVLADLPKQAIMNTLKALQGDNLNQ